MGEALRNVLPLAIAVAVFPVPIIAVVLLVGSDRGRAKAAAFVVAWIAGLAGIAAIVLLIGGAADASDDGEPATWVSVLLLVLGVLALLAAAKQWLGRPRGGEEPPTPGWMRSIDDLTLVKAGGLGFALTALNPKNVLLTVAAGAEIAELALPPSQQVAGAAVFVLVASAGVLAPLVLSLALGERARQPLDATRRWMIRNSVTIMSVLFLLIGAKLIGDAISGLTG